MRQRMYGGVRGWYSDMPLYSIPLTSTVKAIVAINLLSLIEKKQIILTDEVTLDLKNIVPGSGQLKQKIFSLGKYELSIQNLLYHMMVNSDNTATDAIINLIGGVGQLQSFLKEHNLEDIFIDHNIHDLMSISSGFNQIDNKFTLFESVQNDPSISFIPGEIKLKGALAFDQNLYNTCTPKAMTDFLVKFFNYEILSVYQTNYLLNIMEQCLTGPNRIKSAVLPHIK